MVAEKPYLVYNKAISFSNAKKTFLKKEQRDLQPYLQQGDSWGVVVYCGGYCGFLKEEKQQNKKKNLVLTGFTSGFSGPVDRHLDGLAVRRYLWRGCADDDGQREAFTCENKMKEKENL